MQKKRGRPVSRECRYCGAELANNHRELNHIHGAYCSYECLKKYSAAYSQKKQVCSICGELFPVSRKGQRYCSRECSRIANAANRRRESIENAIDGYKQCSKCKVRKPLSEFNKSPKAAIGYQSQCKACQQVNWQEFIQKHPEWVAKSKARYKMDTVYRERIKERKKQYLPRRRQLENSKNKDPLCRLRYGIARSIWLAIKKNKAGRSWEKLVGYDLVQLKEHLQKRFLPGMTWENYGEWHIDHIIPKSAFNYSTAEHIDFKRCWALKNLRPLWAHDNIVKHNKLDKPFQPALELAYA
jgi:hypothetical protein